jgi:hypothetical protein
MVRELGLCLVAALCGGCSLVLNFNNNQIPIDAEIDGPYSGDECAYMEPNDTADTAMTVTTADMGPAAICRQARDSGLADDLDYYKFTVPTGTTKVTISMMSIYRPGGDLDLVLYDVTGTMRLAQSRGFTDNETIVCPAASPACAMLVPADYVFAVIPAVPGHVNSYTFSLALQ